MLCLGIDEYYVALLEVLWDKPCSVVLSILAGIEPLNWPFSVA